MASTDKNSTEELVAWSLFIAFGIGYLNFRDGDIGKVLGWLAATALIYQCHVQARNRHVYIRFLVYFLIIYVAAGWAIMLAEAIQLL